MDPTPAVELDGGLGLTAATATFGHLVKIDNQSDGLFRAGLFHGVRGRGWTLAAFPSTTDGLCLSMTPGGADGTGDGGAMVYGAFESVPRTTETKHGAADMKVTYLSRAGTYNGFPAFVTGAATGDATTVEVRFRDGERLRLPTTPGPAPLDQVTFYAAPLHGTLAETSVDRIAAYDADGHLVACLAPSTAQDGRSPLEARR